MISYDEALEILKKYNQEHLLRFYNEISENEKNNLLKDIENIDFEEADKIIKQNSLATNHEATNYNLSILPIEAIDKNALSKEDYNKFDEIGTELIKNGKVAVCTLAGGQGTRLGHNGPKGIFIVPLKNPKSIFQISAEHLLDAYKKYGTYINWYIMTSEDNDEVTKKFFEDNNFFNYSKDNIKFFKQGILPMTDFNGKILLQTKSKIFTAANGNGGIFKALGDNGIIDELKKNGIEYLSTCNVDNILIKPIDSIMFGIMKTNNSQIGIKSIIKRSPDEPVGVCCLKNNKPTVIEYTDLPKDLAEARNEDGTLKFGETHFGNNYFSTELLEKITDKKLPYHGARKKNNFYDENGNYIEGDKPNSIKYEMFIFDGFEMADGVSILRVKREEEFAPIKNKEGEDSPYTATKLYENYFKNNIN